MGGIWAEFLLVDESQAKAEPPALETAYVSYGEGQIQRALHDPLSLLSESYQSR